MTTPVELSHRLVRTRMSTTLGSVRAVRRFVARALRSMHDASRIRIEGIAAVHEASVVPHDKVANLPLVLPREFRLACMRPKLVK